MLAEGPIIEDGSSARGGIRTHDLLLRRQALYPAELRTQTCWDRGGATVA